MEKKFIGVKELALYLGVSTQVIYQWTHKDKLPYYKPMGKVLFLVDEIDEWVLGAGSVKTRSVTYTLSEGDHGQSPT